MRDDGNIIKKLQEDVVIPANVQAKAEEALASILTATDHNKILPSAPEKKRAPRRKLILLVAAAILLLGTVTVGAAAYIKWSHSIEEGLHATSEETKQMVEDKNMNTFMEQSVTDAGITVTAQQCISDRHFIYISFKVEGYDLPQGKDPIFEHTEFEVEGSDHTSEASNQWIDNMSAGFYDGLTTDNYGRPVNGDGSAIDWDSYDYHSGYIQEDGSLEYEVILSNAEKESDLVGRKVHITLKNLGTAEKAVYYPDIEGTWDFEWVLNGTDDVKQIELDAPLGDSGATVISCELSPISARIEYEFPKSYEDVEAADEAGNPSTAQLIREPPLFVGVEMKDGTRYYYMTEGGNYGYDDKGNDTIYTNTTSFSRIIDTDQVAGLLFQKHIPETSPDITSVDEEPLPQAEDFYMVPLE